MSKPSVWDIKGGKLGVDVFELAAPVSYVIVVDRKVVGADYLRKLIEDCPVGAIVIYKDAIVLGEKSPEREKTLLRLE